MSDITYECSHCFKNRPKNRKSTLGKICIACNTGYIVRWQNGEMINYEKDRYLFSVKSSR